MAIIILSLAAVNRQTLVRWVLVTNPDIAPEMAAFRSSIVIRSCCADYKLATLGRICLKKALSFLPFSSHKDAGLHPDRT